MPAPVIGHEEDAKLVSQCLDFCQTLAGKSLTFSFSLTIGTNFAFSVDTVGNGTLASKEKKKKPTPSAMRRNARRREEFLNKKRNTSTAAKPFQSKPAAAKEAEAPANAPSGLHHHPSPSPSSERRQVITVGREKDVPTFSQLDGAPPVAAAKPPSHSSAASSPASPPSRPDKEHQGGELRATWEPDLFGDLRAQGPQGIAFPRRAALPLCLQTQGLLNQNLLRYSLGHVTGFVQIGAAAQRRLRRIEAQVVIKATLSLKQLCTLYLRQ